MRHLLIAALIVGAAACNAEGAHDPSATVINVRVLDDRGVPAGRHQLIVTPPAATRVDAQTRNDGTAELRVTDAGTYTIKVIPRDGYVAGLDPLSKIVTVVTNGTTGIEFTLLRAGVSASELRPGG